MLYHIMTSQDIRTNLATEHYLLQQNFSQPLLLFYQQKPSVIIGRYQNAREEVALNYLAQQAITLTRRISGGGAVYDDLGNLSFGFILPRQAGQFGDFRSFTQPILQALQAMGATDVTIDGRNDLVIEDRKFSGNAMFKNKHNILSHGTLLYDSDLNVLPQVLSVSPEKLASKSTKSVRSRVTNLRPFLAPAYQNLSTLAFCHELIKHIYHTDSLQNIAHQQLRLSPNDHQKIQQLVTEIYANDDWIFGAAPPFTLQCRRRFPAVGIVDARLTITEGRIQQLTFFGDFFSEKPAALLAEQLQGLPFTRRALQQLLNRLNVGEYITHLTSEDLLSLFFDQGAAQ